jgi:prepilin-type processing-associated H-X9-DG protein
MVSRCLVARSYAAWILLAIATVGLCAWLYYRQYYVTLTLLAGVLVTLYALPSTYSQPASRRAQCINNLKQITMALLEYEEDHGHLPPPYTTDDQGNPLQSWRVLILPYLEYQQLYDAIDLTKPWYHPDNLALQSPMPEIFRCPSFESNPGSLDLTTAYVVVVGDRTAWPCVGQREFREITDGLFNTLAVLESEQQRLHWMSTDDPWFEAIEKPHGVGDTPLANGVHNGGSNYSLLDGAVRFLDGDLDFQEFVALITIDDGEKLERQTGPMTPADD